jgi:hypothetical protein
MTRFTVGSDHLLYEVWDYHRRDEFKDYLARCDQGALLVGEDNYGRDGHVSLLLETREGQFEGRFAIGIEDISRSFAMLIDHKHLNIIFGNSSNVVMVHVPSRAVVARYDTVTMFSQFHHLASLGIEDFFLIETGTSITAMTYTGLILWKNDYVSGRTAIRITREAIVLDLDIQSGMPPTKLILDILTGQER